VSFGGDLRRERELRGISLDEISRETKISVRLLEAMELDRFDLLPGGIFRKAFVRNYANYIGLNEEKVLQEYALQVESEEKGSTQEAKGMTASSLSKVPASQSVKVVLTLLLVIVSLAGSAWYFQRSARRNQVNLEASKLKASSQQPLSPSSQPPLSSQQPPVSSPGVAPATVSDSTGSPGPTTPVSMPATTGQDLRVLGELAKKPEAPVTTPGPGKEGDKPTGELSLKVKVLQETWMSVESGDSTLYSGLLYPEQTRSFSLQQQLKITLGNAGGVQFSVNNQPLAPVGKPGEVRVVVINAENYHQLLVPGP
jgi:cytoskeleton protein RodZ